MTTFNKTITFEEATKLYKSTNAQYPSTEHNKNMIKKVIDAHLMSLRK